MTSQTKKLGVIVGVNGDLSQVGMYSMSNDSQFLWYGETLIGPKIGAFITINQNDIKIIATVSSEKIIDQQNTVKSVEFDNRFHKNSINRIVVLKTKGVIENNKFQVTSQYVPMIGNEVTLTTKEELDLIFGIGRDQESIYIGKSILEGQDIKIPINKFFASHIGVFGNTGSGKSNTLHKLYLELLNSISQSAIFDKSQFFVIDFNGEYVGNNMFGVSDNKKIFEINTRDEKKGNKLPIKRDYLFDADILSILFDAKPGTQVPFLRNALKEYKNKVKDGKSFANMEIGLLLSLLKGYKDIDRSVFDNWIKAADYLLNDDITNNLKDCFIRIYAGNTKIIDENKNEIFKDGGLEDKEDFLKIEGIRKKLMQKFEEASEIQKLSSFLEFQKVYVSAWKSTNIEHINPLFHRIKSAFESLEKVIKIEEKTNNKFSGINIISLVQANQEIKRLIPMLLSKMVYDEQKAIVSGNEVTQTKHLIIDEAHNILNSELRNNGDSWQDYRLSVFEEIIKEGRKFGFFLTLSSQRPADISPTIVSQLHNFIIHRLVNDKDLKMLENTMPTLDRSSYQMIPSLGQGEAIITGNSIQIPVFVKVEKEEQHPKSDDVILTNLWSNPRIKQLTIF